MPWILWIVGVLGALIMAAAGVSPHDAISNLASWAEYFGVNNLPAWLSSKSADNYAITLGVVLILVAIGLGILRQLNKIESASDMPIFDEAVANNLQGLWERGDNLGRNRDINTSLRGNEAVQAGDWINEVCSYLREHLPHEEFLFRSIGGAFNSSGHQTYGILFQKLGKLRLIIGRYEEDRGT